MRSEPETIILGWKEWASLPNLGIPAIKTKVDTGAKTSTLHAFLLEPFRERGKDKIRFSIHPLQKRVDIRLTCVADVIDCRIVSDSGGHRETRYVIQTLFRLGEREWPIEITLTNRDTMLFRMLLGRSAMTDRILVDPGSAYLCGRPEKVYRVYKHLLAKP